MPIKSILFLACALLGVRAFAGWQVGDAVPFFQCEPGEAMTVSSISGSYPTPVRERILIKCRNTQAQTSKLYILESTVDKETKLTNTTVVRVMDGNDPAQLLFADGKFSHYLVQSYHDNPDKSRSYATMALYLANKTAACPDSSEVMQISLENQRGVSTLSQPQSSGICLVTPMFRTGTVDGLNILDEEQNADGTVRVAAYSDGMTKGKGATEIVVLEISTKNPVKLLARINDPSLFPNGCGKYLVAARFLPKTTQLALAYKTPKLISIDYQNANNKILFNDERKGFSTCEGYMPNFNSLRNELWVRTSYKDKIPTSELFFLTTVEGRPTLQSFPIAP